MSQSELLITVIAVLNQSNIEYMLTGSIVSSLQGEPRSTHDIDMVIVIKPEQIHRLASAFSPPGYYLDEDSMLEAIRNQAMFNLIDVREGDKVDFWLLTDEPFDMVRFSRKQRVEYDGAMLNISSPEDTILAKLRWTQISGGSEKQFGDAVHVYEVQYPYLDREYLDTWVKQMKLEELWERLISEAVVG